MTHTQALLHELVAHGRTSYRQLLARYGHRGYTYHGFTVAVRRLRKAGAIPPAPPSQNYDIIASHCPCCGRALERQDER